MLLCRVDCIILNILHQDYTKPLTLVASVAAADVSSLLEAIEDPPGGPFLRGVYISMEPSVEQISLIETAIAAEFETVLN
jgi:hypothetical protein